MIYARIAGTGSCLPGAPVTNDDLVARGIDTSDEWITTRTGIRARHFAADGQSASDLAEIAARRAIEAAGMQAEDVDLIIVATSTPDYIFPSTAALLQSRLGIRNESPAFDVQAVCSGFVYALTVAEKFIRSGSHKRALVVGAEVFSRILDWQDRTTCVLFGDGAGAIMLEASETPGILSTALHADGSHHPILCVPGTVASGKVLGDPFLRMDGQAVFKFAVRVLGDVAQEVLASAASDVGEVDWLIPHQANIRIIHSTAKRLGLPLERVVSTVDAHGNTSAASIPLALDVAIRDGRIQRGQRLVLEGVGGGFTWGAALVQY
ncbi:beta-ketoacyl-ACP synthase III [Denitromonas iodatirespirans]|uniref:Beta-ketoacyl-[acyl-carrier-protein] synthase III n=1 Tax=Denitromonas iodatirespirans TaxID=2795389 RepID=A0A944DBH9_DENI1|nr:beta-ketoacyl-ACP synthase III [Denitromonas iodatirespirans]MBT0961382.1 ketoacyl-ACP synthase III [Denitromonas iodatirespirans]